MESGNRLFDCLLAAGRGRCGRAEVCIGADAAL